MKQLSSGIGPLALTGLLCAAALTWFGLLPAPAFDLIFVLSLGVSLLGSLPRFGMARPLARLSACVFVTISLCIVLLVPGTKVVPFLAIALAYGQLTYVFAHGLMPGRQPILEQLIRLMAILPGGAPEFWRFVRGQCVLWAGVGAFVTLLALLAALLPQVREQAGWILTLTVIVQLGIFVLSHLYANWRYGRPETWVATLKAMFQPAIWSKLEL